MAIVHFEGPDEKWMSRAAARLFLDIPKNEFYGLIRSKLFPAGRPRPGYKGLWYSREDMAWMLWYSRNQQCFTGEIKEAVNPKKPG